MSPINGVTCAVITWVATSLVTLAAAGGISLTPAPRHSFHVSKMDPSGSCVPNSGLRKEKMFLKGAGHQRRLCSVEPQLQQRPLYCTQVCQRASSERSGVHRDRSVLRILFVSVQLCRNCDRRRARGRSRRPTDLYGNELAKHLEHHGRHIGVQRGACCCVARSRGKPRMLLHDE